MWQKYVPFGHRDYVSKTEDFHVVVLEFHTKNYVFRCFRWCVSTEWIWNFGIIVVIIIFFFLFTTFGFFFSFFFGFILPFVVLSFLILILPLTNSFFNFFFFIIIHIKIWAFFHKYKHTTDAV